MRLPEAPPGSRGLRLLLAPDVDAPATARRALRDLPLGGREDDVLLLASELVTNAVVHGGLAPDQPIQLAVACERGGTRVEVRDDGEGFGPGTPPAGFGLGMVAEAAERWGIECEGATSVWFETEPRRPRMR